VPLIVHDDLEAAVQGVHRAQHVGNFHTNVAARMGYEDEVRRVQDLYFEGRRDGGAAGLPTRLLEELALNGPPDKLRHDLEPWRESIATTLLVSGNLDMLRQAAELVLR